MRRSSGSSRCNRMQAAILAQLPTPTQTLLLRYYIFSCQEHDSVREDDPGTSVFVYAIHRIAILYTTLFVIAVVVVDRLLHLGVCSWDKYDAARHILFRSSGFEHAPDDLEQHFRHRVKYQE